MSIRKLAAPATMVCAAILLLPGAASAQAPSTGTATSDLQNIPITGKARNGKAFTGRFSVNRFVTRGGKTFAVGRLTGKVGKRSVKRASVAIPASIAPTGDVTPAASCPILHLVLGPLDLDLLGLKVHLDRVVLDITAQSGPGNLLGNLLCGIVNLLNTPGLPVQQVTALLNIILQLLTTPGLTSL